MFQNTILTQDIKAVILVAARDFGRCPLASKLNRALWPVLGKPALQRLIEQLVNQGIRRIVVSCEGQANKIKTALNFSTDIQVRFTEETFPRGPAGGIRDVIEPAQDKQILVLPACTVTFPDLNELAALHIQSQAEMTVFGLPENEVMSSKNQAQIYMCQASIYDHIPERGYFDIKEGLVPVLVKAGKVIYGTNPSVPIISYTNWHEYILALKHLLIDRSSFSLDQVFSPLNGNPDVWIGQNVQVSQTAKVIGPAVIGHNSMIAEKTLLFGPSVIGNNVSIGPESIIEESVLWDHSIVGSKCRVRESLIDDGKTIPNHAVISSQLKSTHRTFIQKVKNTTQGRIIKARIKHQFSKNWTDERVLAFSDIFQKTTFGIIGPVLTILVLISLIITYWNPTLKDLWGIWMRSDEYSSGLLVPFVAIYVIWLRRGAFFKCRIRPNLWGLVLLVAVQFFRYWGLYYMFDSGERLSFVLSIGSLVLFVFGTKVFRYFLPVFLFLFLMLPLPKRIETLVTTPLQVWATVSSVFCLEALGFDVVREGNIININGTLVAVAEACNGLRMLTAFIVVSSLIALIVHRKRWVKAIILVSSIPVALICNTIRLTLTSYAFTKLDAEAWEKAFHDFGGLVMIPLALGLIFLELWLLSNVMIEPKKRKEKIIVAKH